MKATLKSPEPEGLVQFRAANPLASWEDLREEYRDLYTALKIQIAHDQGYLCAYCEIAINHDDALRFRVEHLHSKADAFSDGVNWALHWPNLLGVCLGGSQKANPADHYLPPLPLNLTCDAHKQHLESTGKLPIPCDGHVLNPLNTPSFPLLVRYLHGTGELVPDPKACAQVDLSTPAHPDTLSIVARTIEVFNLNCPRLCQARKTLAYAIEHRKKDYRIKGITPDRALPEIAFRFFRTRHPAFFSTIRSCLGADAEAYLRAVNFVG